MADFWEGLGAVLMLLAPVLFLMLGMIIALAILFLSKLLDDQEDED